MYFPLCSNAYNGVTNFKICNFTKTQKSRYLESKTFFPEIKKFTDFTSRGTLLQKPVL